MRTPGTADLHARLAVTGLLLIALIVAAQAVTTAIGRLL